MYHQKTFNPSMCHFIKSQYSTTSKYITIGIQKSFYAIITIHVSSKDIQSIHVSFYQKCEGSIEYILSSGPLKKYVTSLCNFRVVSAEVQKLLSIEGRSNLFNQPLESLDVAESDGEVDSEDEQGNYYLENTSMNTF